MDDFKSAPNEERMHSVVDHVLDGIITIDETGSIITFNPAAERIFGYSCDEAIGQNVKTLMPEPDRGRHDDYIANYLRTGKAKIIGAGREVVGQRKDGSPFPMELAISEFHVGGRRYFTGIVRDITERKQAEAKLRASGERLRKIVSIETVGVLFFNLDGRVVDANATLRRMLGYSVEELRRMHWEQLTPIEHRDRTARAAQELASQGKTAPYEKEFIRKDGSRFWGLFAPTVLAGRGNESECVEFIIDISESKRNERALREADRRKDEFLATLAHELRNPLAPIRNAVAILNMQGPMDPVLRTSRDIIERQVRHMARLIDDLLDVSRITRGALPLRRARVALATVIEEALETTRPHLGHELTVSLPREPIYLDADPVRLAQVFSNLLNNATKYTEKGGRITVTAEQRDGEALVRVRDTGIGIPAEELPRIFEMFSQVTPTLEHTHGGLGIGLSLTRAIVQMHGGGIEAYSEGVGRGSEFVVRLPLPSGMPAERTEDRVQDPNRMEGGRAILVVDDNHDAAQTLATLLRLEGHEVHVAHDGVEAVDKAGAWRPEVVLLDIGMPKMNGYDACRAIRALPSGRDISIIAISGWGQENDRRKSKEAGFDGHLVKPVEHGALQRLLTAILAGRTKATPA